jgi:death-on-curing protein
MYVVTADNLRDIHDEIIEESGGSHGVLATSTLEYISFECNRKKGVFVKAAVALHGIVTMHPFIDGNKRTGFTIADVILRRHDYEIIADDSETIRFLLEVARYKLSVKEIEEWLRKNTVKA